MTASTKIEFDGIRDKIKKGNLQILFVRAFGTALLFIMNIVLARYLSVAEFGLFNFTMLFSLLVAKVFALGWPDSILRFIPQYIEQGDIPRLKGVIKLAYEIPLLSCLIISTVMAAATYVISMPHELAAGIRLTAILSPLLILTILRRQIFMATRSYLIGIVPDEIILPAVMIIMVYVLYISTAMGAVVIYSLSILGIFVATRKYIRKSLPSGFEKEIPAYDTQNWLRVSFSMILGGVSFLLLNRVSAIFLGFLDDMEAVGLYSSANRVAMLLSILLATMETVVVPMLSSAYYGGRHHEIKVIMNHSRKWLILVSMPVFAFMIIFPEYLLGYFGDGYKAAANVLRILSLAQFVNVATGPVGYAMMMTGHERAAAWMTAAAAVLNVCVNIVLIPKFGVEGSAVATAISIIALNIGMAVYVSKYILGKIGSAQRGPLT